MVSYSHRPQSGQITCYLNRTYHVLPTMLLGACSGGNPLGCIVAKPRKCLLRIRTGKSASVYECVRFCPYVRFPRNVNVMKTALSVNWRPRITPSWLVAHPAVESSNPKCFSVSDSRRLVSDVGKADSELLQILSLMCGQHGTMAAAGAQFALPENCTHCAPFKYLSNQATVRRIASTWFSRFSNPWPSFG